MELIKAVGLASDHAGYELKQEVKKWLDEKGITYKDFGAFNSESSDYPDFAHPLAESIESHEFEMGIGICGSGEGMAMTLNKHQEVRAALCWIPQIAEITRRHNNANILVLPARFLEWETVRQILEIFFSTKFEGGRHLRRILKMPVQK